MATYTWNTNSGAFDTAGNWQPSGPPGTGDVASFATGSGTISGTGNVGALVLGSPGPWVWTGTLSASTWSIADMVTLATGAAWTLTGMPVSNGNNTLNVYGGGSLIVTGGATISEAANTASTAASAIYLGATGSTGTLGVTGSGSSVNTGSNAITIGAAGTGDLVVANGGTATFGTTDSTQRSALSAGANAGATGNITVTGSGSAITASGFATIGRAGTGTLTLSNGATFTGGSAASGNVGFYNVNIGDSSSSTASTQVYGGSGTVQVSSGATFRSLGGVSIGSDGSTGAVTADGSGTLFRSDNYIRVGYYSQRGGGTGSLTVQNGATARALASTNGNANVAIGNGAGATGTVTVTGTGSLLDTNGFRMSIGTSASRGASGGTGTLNVNSGGRVVTGSSGYTDTEAALGVGAATGGVGVVSINGGTMVVNGTAVLGGTNTGSGVYQGGTGTVSVAGGGSLTTGAMTIYTGSSLSVDQSSTLTTPSIALQGGTADLYTLTSSNAVSFGTSSILRVHGATGSNAVTGFTFGDEVDVAAGTSVSLSGSTLTVGSGTISLGAAPANASYQLFSDGSGGTFAALTPKTIGVYRFFDTTYGTHFYTADPNEAKTVAATRPDLVPEGPGGIGLQAVAVQASDPNAVAVYRFFDSTYGTHFFTASATERDSVIATRPDLVFEASATFYEHASAQPGDTAVYRYFDDVHGTHFYTDSASERATIAATRPDLIAEGVGFYEPAQNYMT